MSSKKPGNQSWDELIENSTPKAQSSFTLSIPQTVINNKFVNFSLTKVNERMIYLELKMCDEQYHKTILTDQDSGCMFNDLTLFKTFDGKPEDITFQSTQYLIESMILERVLSGPLPLEVLTSHIENLIDVYQYRGDNRPNENNMNIYHNPKGNGKLDFIYGRVIHGSGIAIKIYPENVKQHSPVLEIEFKKREWNNELFGGSCVEIFSFPLYESVIPSLSDIIKLFNK